MTSMVGHRTGVQCESRWYSIGPYCTDERIETSESEKDDCFTDAKMRMQAEVHRCFRDIPFTWVPNGSGSFGGDIPCYGEGCKNHIQCYITKAYFQQQARNCFCPKPTTICVTCDADPIERAPGGRITERTTRLRPIRLTTSTYDVPIPIIFGKVFIGGNIIWVGNERTNTISTRTQTGFDTTVEIVEQGFVDLALGLCRGPIDGIRRLWLDDELIYDNSGLQGNLASISDELVRAGMSFQFYSGDPSQKPFDKHVQDTGYGRTPAYRDLAVLYFENLPVNVVGNRIPTIRVEVYKFSETTGGTPAKFEETVEHSLESFVYDFPSDRLIASRGEDLLYFSGDGLSLEEVISLDEGIIPKSVTVTPEGHTVFIAGEELVYVWGPDRTERYSTFSNVPNYAEFVDISATELTNLVGETYTLITIITTQSILYYRVDVPGRRIEFMSRHDSLLPDGELYRIVHGNFVLENASVSAWRLIVIGVENGSLKTFIISLEDSSVSNYFDPDARPSPITLSPDSMGLTDPEITVEDAFVTINRRLNLVIRNYDSVLLVTLDAAILPEHLKTSVLPGYSPNTKYNVRSPGGTISYINEGELYQFNIDTGNYTKSRIGVVKNSAGLSWWDPIRQSVTYLSEDGSIVRAHPFMKYSSDGAEEVLTDCADIIGGTLRLSGILPRYLDTNRVEHIRTIGYIIQDQSNAKEVLDEIREFFHLLITETDGKIRAVSLQDLPSLNVDEGMETRDSVRDFSVDRVDIRSVSVSYFDEELRGDVNTQTVSKDMIGDYDSSSLYGIEDVSFSPALYERSSVVVGSAELSLLREIQQGDTHEFFIRPGRIEIQPGDFIGDFRVKSVDLDSSFVSRIFLTYDDRGKYEDTVPLIGYTPEYVDDSPRTYDVPVKNFPIILPYSPLWDNPHEDIVFVGLLSPYGEFSPTSIFSGGGISVGTPEKALVIGRVLDPLLGVTNQFTTDRRSVLRIRFDSPISSDDFTETASLSDIIADPRRGILFVGKEIVQYKDFTILDDRTVQFTTLLRGRFGTDHYVNSHVSGERVYVYDTRSVKTVPVTSTETIYRTVSIVTRDERSPNRFRRSTLDVPESFLIRDWRADFITLNKEFNDIIFQMRPRISYSNTFRDDHEEPYYFGNGIPTLFVLSDAFDEDRFMSKILEGNIAPSIDSSRPRNDYILRMFTDISGRDSTEYGEYYYAFAMNEDSIDMQDTLHLATAVMSLDGYPSSDVVGFRFERRIIDEFKTVTGIIER